LAKFFPRPFFKRNPKGIFPPPLKRGEGIIQEFNYLNLIREKLFGLLLRPQLFIERGWEGNKGGLKGIGP